MAMILPMKVMVPRSLKLVLKRVMSMAAVRATSPKADVIMKTKTMKMRTKAMSMVVARVMSPVVTAITKPL